jgi:uncharacterized protein (DUF486 family)
MKRPMLPLLATVLSIVISALFAISYMNTRNSMQMIMAILCLIIGVTMFMRYRRIRIAPPVDT